MYYAGLSCKCGVWCVPKLLELSILCVIVDFCDLYSYSTQLPLHTQNSLSKASVNTPWRVKVEGLCLCPPSFHYLNHPTAVYPLPLSIFKASQCNIEWFHCVYWWYFDQHLCMVMKTTRFLQNSTILDEKFFSSPFCPALLYRLFRWSWDLLHSVLWRVAVGEQTHSVWPILYS